MNEFWRKYNQLGMGIMRIEKENQRLKARLAELEKGKAEPDANCPHCGVAEGYVHHFNCDAVTKLAVEMSDHLDASEQAMFIAGFQECMKYYNKQTEQPDPKAEPRNCHNCKYAHIYAMDAPCRQCNINEDDLWEPKTEPEPDANCPHCGAVEGYMHHKDCYTLKHPDPEKPFEDTPWTDTLFEIYIEAKADGRETISFAEVDERLKGKAEPEVLCTCLNCKHYYVYDEDAPCSQCSAIDSGDFNLWEPKANPKPHLCNTCNESPECDGRNYKISVCDFYKPKPEPEPIKEWRPKTKINLDFDNAFHNSPDEKIINKALPYILQLQWLYENYPEQEGNWGKGTEYSVRYDMDNKEYVATSFRYLLPVNLIFMSRKATKHLAADMNSGKVRF